MGTEVLMPKLGLTMTKGRVVEWKREEGERVEKGEVIAVIESEKITYNLKAPASGVLLKIYVPAKVEVPVGQIIAYIGEPGESPPAAPPAVEAPAAPAAEAAAPPKAEARPAAEVAVRATPRARRLAKEKGVDLTRIKGTGPGGLITESDVLREIERMEKYTEAGVRVKEALPLTPMRETIMRRMVESLRTMAQVTLMREAVVDALVAVREELLPEIESKAGVRVTYTDILVKVVAELIKKHPLLNSVLEGGKIKVLDEVNIGVAVAVDHGLIVPVVKGADGKDLASIAKEVRELASKAREGTLTPDEVSGGTFTITNLGMFGVDAFTPIINPPQSAILGVGRIQRRPVAVGDEMKVADTMWLSLTFDHRVMDGHTAARFLEELASVLNDADRLRGILRGGRGGSG